MMEIIPTIKGTMAMTGIIAASGMTAMLADVISQDSPITVGAAIGVGAACSGIAVYVTKHLQKTQSQNRKNAENIRQNTIRLRRIENKLKLQSFDAFEKNENETDEI